MAFARTRCFLILEGIVTTLNADGTVNISPMGPHVDDDAAPNIVRLLLKPYNTSTTYQNLKRTGAGVSHVTDDVEMIARAAVGDLDPQPPLLGATAVEGRILAGQCRYYELHIRSLDDSRERVEIACDVVAAGRLRDFLGFNRAKHAVLEASILATRTDFLPPETIRTELARLRPLVEKTAGPAERRAFEFLEAFVESKLPRRDS